MVPAGLVGALKEASQPPNLVLCTGNLLGAVPVAALRVGDSYLAELAYLSVVPSLDLWESLRSRRPGSGTGILAYVDPELPGARREQAALGRSLPSVTWTTAGELRQKLTDATRYAAVVIAAHGSPPIAATGPHLEGAARAGLAQSLALGTNDYLTAADLLTAKLPSGLITASCWSGRLPAQTAMETHGIPTAALIAGARWVLAGVVDTGGITAGRLMSTFYEKLSAGTPPAEALHHAHREFLDRRPTAPPGGWASLSVVGDGCTPFSIDTLPQPQNGNGATDSTLRP